VASVDIIDELYVVADPAAVRAATCEVDRWRVWFPELVLTPYDDRGLLGVRWRLSGALTGTAEVWLEEFGDGVIVHTYVRAVVAPKARTGVRLKGRRASWKRWPKFYALSIKRRMTEVKDELEAGRDPGVARVPLAERDRGDAAKRVVLRAATSADADAVAQIWFDGWQDGHRGHVPAEPAAVRTPESFWERAPQRVDDTVLATVETEVAGFVMVVGAEVEQVYVDSRHRGSGVADALLVEAERRVWAGGHEVAWLAVATGNARARRFYERRGWTDDGAFDYPAAVGDGVIPVPCHRYVKWVIGRS
jgi:ribosomal protein S18 acetylase RimI-like enzyme